MTLQVKQCKRSFYTKLRYKVVAFHSTRETHLSINDIWRQSADVLYSKMPRLQPHRLVKELDLDPIYFSDNHSFSTPLFQSETDYWNICEWLPEEKSAFLQDPLFALFVGHDYKGEGLSEIKRFYFKSSPLLTTSKIELCERIDSNNLVDVGVEPYTLGLWKSQLYPSKLDLKSYQKIKNSNWRLFRLSTLAFDLAGASATQQVAVLMTSMVQLIEDYRGEIEVEDLFKTLSLEVSLTSHLMSDSIKIEATKLLFAKLVEVYGGDESWMPKIYCIPSPRYLSAREPWTNLLRFSTMNMASVMAQASGFTHLPFDIFSKNSQHRISRNIDLINRHEAFLDKVAQPWSGSGAFQIFLDRFCDKSWLLFQELSQKGGLISALRSGWIQTEIEMENRMEIESFLNRSLLLTGVNQYVLADSLGEDYPLTSQMEKKSIESWWVQEKDSIEVEPLCEVKKLIPLCLSDFYEKWQLKSDNYKQNKNKPLKALLHIEKGLEQNPKISLVKARLNLAAIGTSTQGPLADYPIHVVMAADPEGEFAQTKLKELKSLPVYRLWGGEKKMTDYHHSLGATTDMTEVFDNLFSHLGEV